MNVLTESQKTKIIEGSGARQKKLM